MNIIRNAISFFRKKFPAYPDRFWLAGILLLAVFFLVPVFFVYQGPHIFAGDDGSWAIATNLVNGKGYSACSREYFPFCGDANQSTAMREPIPVLLMALAMSIHPRKVSGLIVQSLLYLGTIPMLYLVLKKGLKSRSFTALFAAFLWAISIPVLNHVDYDSGNITAAFFFSVGLFFFLKGCQGESATDWLLSGLFMGMAALSRTIFLGIAVGLGLFLLARKSMGFYQSLREKYAGGVSFLVAMIVVFSPWVIRNYMVFDQLVIGSTLTGYNVFRMNFIVAEDIFSPHYVGLKESSPALVQLIKDHTFTGLENEAQMQSVYMKAGLQIIAQHPFRYLALSIYRFLPLWFDISVSTAYNSRYYVTDYLVMIKKALLLILVLFGLQKNRASTWPVILSLFLGCAAYMAIDAQQRYMVELMPAVVILAALGMENAFSWGQQKMQGYLSLDGLA